MRVRQWEDRKELRCEFEGVRVARVQGCEGVSEGVKGVKGVKGVTV